MSFTIVPAHGERPLTQKQIAHVKRILAQWKVTSAAKVEYSPTYGWIDASDPKIELEFEQVAFKDDGETAFNMKQVDGFSFKLKKWSPPHKRDPEATKTHPQNAPWKARLRQQRDVRFYFE
jgi:hypothetical protein